MRTDERILRRLNRVPALVALATVGLLLALACPAAIARAAQASPAAAAKPSGDPVRFWSLGRFDRGSGAVTVASDSLPHGTLRQSIEVAPATFDFQPPFPYSSFLSPKKASAGVSRAPTAPNRPSSLRRPRTRRGISGSPTARLPTWTSTRPT